MFLGKMKKHSNMHYMNYYEQMKTNCTANRLTEKYPQAVTDSEDKQHLGLLN